MVTTAIGTTTLACDLKVASPKAELMVIQLCLWFDEMSMCSMKLLVGQWDLRSVPPRAVRLVRKYSEILFEASSSIGTYFRPASHCVTPKVWMSTQGTRLPCASVYLGTASMPLNAPSLWYRRKAEYHIAECKRICLRLDWKSATEFRSCKPRKPKWEKPRVTSTFADLALQVRDMYISTITSLWVLKSP